MSDDKKEYDKPVSLDMPMDEALDRFVAVTKEEIQEKDSHQADLLSEGETQLVKFRGKEVRQVFHENEWVFSVVDVMAAITGTDRPSKYWADLKKKLIKNEGFTELSDKIGQLPMIASDGKRYKTDVVNTETLFRIIQSIPSKKVEAIKRWLAKVGFERIQEEQDPEIAIKRAMLTYKAKGRTDEWINARLQTIVSRKVLTREWQQRGVQDKQYGILTDAISNETFGVKTKQHKELKGLKSQNLRDHMSPLELALTMLGETTTSELTKSTNAQGFKDNLDAAHSGGMIAGRTRKNIEKQLGKSIVTEDNFLPGSKQKKFPE